MATTVFHERYGEVTRAQLAAYRKHNVSQSDHCDLADVFGEDNHAAITAAVKNPKYHLGTSFSVWKFRNN